jgi:hypothetical protein
MEADSPGDPVFGISAIWKFPNVKFPDAVSPTADVVTDVGGAKLNTGGASEVVVAAAGKTAL